MTTIGQIFLLCAFVGSGYAAFACFTGWRHGQKTIAKTGAAAGLAGFVALTAVFSILAWALLVKDFRFAYVADYSSRLLPWHYSLSAIWVGQAGSLLLWAWFSGLLAVVYRFWPRRNASELRQPAFGILMGCVCFLAAIMVFAADPMEASISNAAEGAGLSPLLQHPAMLIHPPIVFLAYAGWAIPFALALTALISNRLDASWIRQAQPWALFSWAVLGIGIIVGGKWAYEELGWGGYWAWDPVENGSLIPWLTGTALIHTMMTWRKTGVFKKTALSLAIATFVLCNFATFLTRSGVFSSLHAFSESPIGWLFLALTVSLTVVGGILIVLRRRDLAATRPVPAILSREAMVLISTGALLLLATATCIGTLSAPLSHIIFGKKVVVGLAFYNNVLIPTGLILLAATAMTPLLRWGATPTAEKKRMLLASLCAGVLASVVAFVAGVKHPVVLAVACLATAAVAVLASALLLDARQHNPKKLWAGLWGTLGKKRPQYAGFLIHLGFVCLAVGVTSSSLGTRRHEVVMREGETIEWDGRSIHLAGLLQRELPDRLIAEARLEISTPDKTPVTLLPAQHLHLLQNEWTTEVAVHSTWRGDFYTAVRLGEGDGRAGLTLVYSPMICWIWLGAWILSAGTLIRLWPGRQRAEPNSELPAPKWASRSGKRSLITAASD